MKPVPEVDDQGAERGPWIGGAGRIDDGEGGSGSGARPGNGRRISKALSGSPHVVRNKCSCAHMNPPHPLRARKPPPIRPSPPIASVSSEPRCSRPPPWLPPRSPRPPCLALPPSRYSTAPCILPSHSCNSSLWPPSVVCLRRMLYVYVECGTVRRFFLEMM